MKAVLTGAGRGGEGSGLHARSFNLEMRPFAAKETRGWYLAHSSQRSPNHDHHHDSQYVYHPPVFLSLCQEDERSEEDASGPYLPRSRLLSKDSSWTTGCSEDAAAAAAREMGRRSTLSLS